MSLMKRLQKQEVVLEEISSEKNERKTEIHNPNINIRNKIQEKLIKLSNYDKIHKDEIKEKITTIVNEVIEEDNLLLTRRRKEEIIAQTVDEITGYGPITPLIQNPEITEVMVNGPNCVYIERNGKIETTNITFRDDQQLMYVIEKIVAPLGRRIDESSPMVDARLPNGSRVNAIIPPLALDGPMLTIRKFAEDPFTVDDLISFGTFSPQTGLFLRSCVEARANIIVAGGTGSGKTTTLNVISSFIPSDERIVTIEDAAELKLNQEHVVRLETRPKNIEGRGEVTVRDLVKNSLRMRPDRILVGEVRTGEALDMLQAMNTGHDGSLTTIHANSPRDVLSRLETMVLMAGMELPIKAIREQVASAVDLIVYQSRLKDGSRRITSITEVQGMEGDVITLQDIFVFKSKGKDERGKIKGEFAYTGIKPKLLEKIHDAGIRVMGELFR